MNLGAFLLVAAFAVAGESGEPWFDEVAADLGVEFTHRHFGTGEKYMPENMGAGVAVFDYDGDGRLDLYFVQGAPVVGEAPPEAANRLFRQTIDGTFEDATERAHVGHRGVGMGVAFGDVDGDDDLDLFVSNFGPDVLYRNRGDGTFEDVSTSAGIVRDRRWSSGAAFADLDGDGDLDLYVAAYLDFRVEDHKWCGTAQTQTRAYCHPDSYDAAADRLYRNRGDGTFEEVAAASGVASSPDAKGLGVAVVDLDGDDRLDVFVANDSTANHLYLGRGDGTFLEDALLAGVAMSGAGKPEASMGVVVEDLDGDAAPEIFLTHLDDETNTLYRNQNGLFNDATRSSGLAGPSLPWVGFGAIAPDVDGDGDLDLVVVNGHIIDNIALFDNSRSHRQPIQLFLGDGEGRFIEASEALNFTELLVGRGLIDADLDRDGDLDLVITQNDDRALLLRRRGEAAACVVALDDVGAKVNSRIVQGARSYLSQGPAEVFLSTCDEIFVRRTSGKATIFRGLPSDRRIRMRP